jgi:hypothetical protein
MSTPFDDDYLTPSRAEVERQLLLSYLEEDWWAPWKAHFIVAGVDWERFERSRQYRWFLPGGLRASWLSHDGSVDWDLVRLNAQAEIDLVAERLPGGGRAPIAWIKTAMDNNYTPPWLDEIQARTEFEWIRKLIASVSFQRRGGLERVRRTPQQRAKEAIEKAWATKRSQTRQAFELEMLGKYGLPGAKEDTPAANKLRDELYESGSYATDRTIKRWIRDLAKLDQES